MIGPTNPPMLRTLTLDSSSSVPSSSFALSSSVSVTPRLDQTEWGGWSFTNAIVLKESSGDAVSAGRGGDNDVARYVPSSSEKRRRIANNHRHSSERVNACKRAAAKADEVRHYKDLAA